MPPCQHATITPCHQGRDQATNFGRDYDEKQFKDAATRKIRTFKSVNGLEI